MLYFKDFFPFFLSLWIGTTYNFIARYFTFLCQYAMIFALVVRGAIARPPVRLWAVSDTRASKSF